MGGALPIFASPAKKTANDLPYRTSSNDGEPVEQIGDITCF